MICCWFVQGAFHLFCRPSHARRSLPRSSLLCLTTHARTVPARRAVIRKPGPRACFKRRSAARLSLPRQTCRQGSERCLQALGHCFRASAPQAHFLLTFWGASQKVRRCKSAKRSISTGKTPDADARPKPRAFLPLPLIHTKKSVHFPAKSSASPQTTSSTRPPTLGRPSSGERSFGNRGLEPVSSAEAEPD
ncbi:hypothetical protein EDC59_12118 [Pseudodesulfovibrio indicus]|uniref:Uncharacterized protein n=1 Tax=Pseudodesulfovibrio indicus TaxID=1716143 RepID=A0AA94PI93_9BACT|nr:hypothetical protein EDC59_12118 [Pseudodesulfovibrio indicus]